MAHSNATTNYNLPQFVSTDKPAWLTDVNTAYSDIDTGMHNAQVAADNAQSDATQALSDASSAGTTATAADAKASGAIASISNSFDTTATYTTGDLVMYNNLLYKCIVDVLTPGSWTGTANWERTTIESEIDGLAASNIAYSNTESGLNADNVQDAIDEVVDVKTIAHTVTKNSGVWAVAESIMKQVGNVVSLYIEFTGAGSIASGANCFQGVLNTKRPILNNVNSAGYYGAYPITAVMNNDGNIYVRNTNPNAIDIGSSGSFKVCFTYITA